MSSLSPEYLSQEAFEKLQKEVDFLMKIKRNEISKKLEEAIALGDISENAEYQEAKEDQLMNEARIAELEDLLSRAEIVIASNTKKDEIDLGCAVSLKKKGDNKVVEYQIVSAAESNPLEKKVSKESPLGKTLLGKKVGDKAKVITPSGEIIYTIEGIT